MSANGNKWIDRVIVIICVVSFGSWLVGLAGSPLFHPDRHAPPRSGDQDPAELALAQAYWNRYPDVSGHSYFGENGVLGTNGARTHYLLHGKAEGRRWGPGPTEEIRSGEVLPSFTDRCNEEKTGRPNR
ncbi:hypothetical protein [Desulfofustis glycolicus]|uniref:Uncharacterized protein n=1 Tax=Desulfofustis glycolicus DSM 9705 TaxID=1121409 RepID=A0A1M5X2U4_9BACT|nr:hypothetical protein [Desulfofustis glycolicus]SHH94137.1 hypothetical protein SAMN02745124_02723 [Desulfofustis glycolicus DSM 9705]